MKVVCLLLSLVFGQLIAQEFTTLQFTPKDGLPSSQVYDILQDSQRNIWIATDAGVSRYDGYEFINFTSNEGLADNVIVKMYLGDDGSILMQGLSKKLSIYKKGKIQGFGQNEELLNSLGTDNISSINYENVDRFDIGLLTSCGSDQRSLHFSNGVLSEKRHLDASIHVLKNIWSAQHCPGNSINVKGNIGPSADLPPISQLLTTPDGIYFTSSNKVGQYKNNSILMRTIPARTTKALAVDHKGQIWVGSFGKGVFVFPKNLSSSSPIQFLDAYNVSSIFTDMDGQLWIGTMSRGVLFIKNPYQISFSETKGKSIRSVVIDKNGELLSADMEGGLHRIRFTSWSNVEIASEQLDLPLSKLELVEGNPVKLSQSGAPGLFTKGSFVDGLTCDLDLDNENGLWIGDIYNFRHETNGVEDFNSSSIGFQERVNVLRDDHRGLFVGTLNGLYLYKGDSCKRYPGTEDLQVEDILMVGDLVYFATNGQGVGLLDPRTNEITFLTSAKGLSSDFTRRLIKGPKGRIWMATKKGVSIFSENGIEQLSISDGLPSNEINDLVFDEKYVWIASNEGLTGIELGYFDKKSEELVLTLNGRSGDRGLSNNSSISFDQNQVSFEFKAIDFRINNPIQYRYRLLPDENWTLTTQTSTSYNALSNGEYQFEVSTLQNDGEWGSPQSLNFAVAPPFWLQWWFFLVIALAVAGVLWVIVRYRERKLLKESAAENELNTLKIKALSSQMNPHFIFNSLNSIQNFLIDNDLRKSNKYLTMFAKLMRLVLNNSNKTFVPMRDVLKTLEIYLDLERLRFNDKFSFSIEVDPVLNQDEIRIPAMLMQPFVENAILHGMLPKEGKGKISLEIKPGANQQIKCTITDDGVGRDFLKGKKSTKHKSQGLKITKERLKVFADYFKNDFRYTIHDLKTPEGEPKGTQVELIIPFH